MKHQNMAMLVDFYEFTMSNGYFKSGFFEAASRSPQDWSS